MKLNKDQYTAWKLQQAHAALCLSAKEAAFIGFERYMELRQLREVLMNRRLSYAKSFEFDPNEQHEMEIEP